MVYVPRDLQSQSQGSSQGKGRFVRIYDETSVACCLEIFSNLYKGALVGEFWVKGETSTLVNVVGNIWT